MERWIMFHLARQQALDLAVGFNPTEATNRNLSVYLPGAFIYDHFNEKKLAALLEWQDRAISNGHGQTLGVILDDILGEKAAGAKKGTTKRVMHSDVLDRFLKIGRQRRIFLMVAVQEMSAIPESFKSQVDLVVAFSSNNAKSKAKLHETFFDMMSKEEFKSAFAQCTADFCAMVCDTRVAAVHPRKSVFFTKAELLEPPTDALGNPILPLFRVGRPVYWNLYQHFRLPPKAKRLESSRRW
jgi:hypothetical protein